MDRKDSARQNRNSLFNRIMVGFIIALGVFVVGGLIFISVRRPKTSELASSAYFSEAKVYETAQEVITLLENGNFSELRTDYCDSEMAQQMTDEALAEAKAYVAENWGAFVETKSRQGYEVKEAGKYYAMVQIKSTYENTEAVYTIMFDVNMKLVGLTME